MKGLFFRNFIIYAIVICVSFAALGSAFVYQINSFALQEKMNMLSDTTNRAAESTILYLESSSDTGQVQPAAKLYRSTMTQLAAENEATIFVTDHTGEMLLVATKEGCYNQKGGFVPTKAVETVISNGSYYEMSDLGGYLPGSHFVSGIIAELPGANATDEPEILVFAAISSESTLIFFVNIISTFLLMTGIVLSLTLCVTYFVTWNQVRPLKVMAAASRRFARGDHSTRIPLPRRRNEVYEMAASFNYMADTIERHQTMQRDLIANVSHDLRTPMTTIGGFVDGILDGAIPPDKQEQYLRIVSEEIKRLSRLANSMVTMSKMESSEELIKSPFDMSEMVIRIALGFEQKINDKRIELDLDIPDTCPINGNHDALFQVVYNLFDNALKFVNEEGELKILMEVRGGRLQFNIRNTGSEIDPESLKHIFDRFYKSDKSRGQNPNGSGLGLYIAKTIIVRHGGAIHARSGDGKTEFCFEIPV